MFVFNLKTKKWLHGYTYNELDFPSSKDWLWGGKTKAYDFSEKELNEIKDLIPDNCVFQTKQFDPDAVFNWLMRNCVYFRGSYSENEIKDMIEGYETATSFGSGCLVYCCFSCSITTI